MENDYLSAMKKYIEERVFISSNEIPAQERNVDFDLRWIFNFKPASLDKEFLELFSTLFKFKYKKYNKIQVCGMEAGALPLLAHLSVTVDEVKHSFYIRKSRNKSGLNNQVEGVPVKGIPIIIVDDILNSGTTVKKQILILKEMGFSVQSIFSVIRYRDLSFYEELEKKGISIMSFFEINDFKESLNIENLVPTEEYLPKYDKSYQQEWKLIFSKPSTTFVLPKSAPAIDDKGVYICSDEGSALKIDKNSGDVLWDYKIPFGVKGKRIFSSPLLYKNNLYFGAYDGNFYCLDKVTGKKKWVFIDADYIGSSPCIDYKKGFVYIGLEFGSLKYPGGIAALDANSGKFIWGFYQMQGFTHASPCVSEKFNIVVCGCNDGYIYAFNSNKGTLLWKYKTGGEVKYSGVFCNKRKIVIIGSMDSKVYCLHIQTGKVYAIFEAIFGFYSNPLVINDTVIIGSLDKRVYCYDLQTKKVKWFFTTGGRIFSSPKEYQEGFVIGSNDGRLYYLDSNTGLLKNSIQVSERIVNAPAVDGVALFVPTHAQELYKFIPTRLDGVSTADNKNFTCIKKNINTQPFLKELDEFIKSNKSKLTEVDKIKINFKSTLNTYQHDLKFFLKKIAKVHDAKLVDINIEIIGPHTELLFGESSEDLLLNGKKFYHFILRAKGDVSYTCDEKKQSVYPGELWQLTENKIYNIENVSNDDYVYIVFNLSSNRNSVILERMRSYWEKAIMVLTWSKNV